MPEIPTAIVLMGVSGAGKTTVGLALAESLGWQFVDADDFHSEANVSKMASGEPLTDEDRRPWLATLRKLIESHLESGEPVILACSLLKHKYQDVLAVDDRVLLVFLDLPEHVLKKRLRDRTDHFMKENMLESQIETLEKPKAAITVDATGKPDQIANAIREKLGL